MSDPERLLDRADGLSRALLEAGSSDTPSEHSRRAAALALGVSSLGMAAPAAGVGASGAATGSTATGAASTAVAGKVLLPIGIKSLFVIAAGTVAVAGVVSVGVLAPPASPDPVQPAAPAALVHEPAPLAPSEPLVPPLAIDVQAPEAIVPAIVSRRASVRTPEPTPAPEPEPEPAAVAPTPAVLGLSEEIQRIAQVEAALATHDLNGASQALDDHARDFPSGALLPEAQALRIDLALAEGDGVRARVLARRFLAAHASSPLAPRYRALLAEEQQTAP